MSAILFPSSLVLGAREALLSTLGDCLEAHVEPEVDVPECLPRLLSLLGGSWPSGRDSTCSVKLYIGTSTSLPERVGESDELTG